MNTPDRPRERAEMSGTVRVIAAVIRRGDQFLVCQRPLHKRHGGLWEFPGGKCEEGESDFEAARRELKEELGVELETAGIPVFSIVDPGSVFEIVFMPVSVQGTPACHEHTAVQWSRPEELRELALAPSDRRFVEFLVEGRGYST